MIKQEQTKLHVLAVKTAHVIPMGKTNNGVVEFVGKQYNPETKDFDIIANGVLVLYHPEMIKHLKDGSLLALNEETAIKAGVPLFIKNINKE